MINFFTEDAGFSTPRKTWRTMPQRDERKAAFPKNPHRRAGKTQCESQTMFFPPLNCNNNNNNNDNFYKALYPVKSDELTALYNSKYN